MRHGPIDKPSDTRSDSELQTNWIAGIAGGLLLLLCAVFVIRTRPAHTPAFQWEHSFAYADHAGRSHSGELAEGANGELYGVCCSGGDGGLGTIFKLELKSHNCVVLHSFSGGPEDGSSPQGGIMMGPDGALYGNAVFGGRLNAGIVFRIEPDGSNFRVLHHFGDSESDGRTPIGSVLAGQDGMLFGTSYNGGLYNNGTVFRLNKDGGGYEILHHFEGNNVDGKNPCSTLAIGRAGWIYGTTPFGGVSASGIIYRLMPNGSGFQVLHLFDPQESDAANPYSGLLVGEDGVLFGTASAGGDFGFGAIFKLNGDGTGYQQIHTYRGREGAFPHGALRFGIDGWLYGTTMAGGHADGTVFRMRRDGTAYVVMHRFGESLEDGTTPCGALISVKGGRIFGATNNGGKGNGGALFSVCPL
jgi:uncharacterized repeat protein (TIGR03803 family)